MKSEKGVTLSSVIIYVIAMLLVVSIITVLTGYYYKNIDINSKHDQIMKQYTKFNSYFVVEVEKQGNHVLDAGSDTITEEEKQYTNTYILFSSGNLYTFSQENNSIYFNQIKICEHIKNCTFSVSLQDGRYKIVVTLTDENDNSKTTTYYLNNQS